MIELNSQVVAALEQGKLREVMLGEGEYFLPDTTFRDSHNIMMVMFVFLHWIQSDGCRTSMVVAFEELLLGLAVSNPWKCVDLLLSYTITSRDSGLSVLSDFQRVFVCLEKHLGDDSSGRRDKQKSMRDLERRFTDIGINVGV